MEELNKIANRIKELETENESLKSTINSIELNASKALTKADQKKLKTAFDKMDGIKALLIEKGIYTLEEKTETAEANGIGEAQEFDEYEQEILGTSMNEEEVITETEQDKASELDELYKRKHMILLGDRLTQEDHNEIAEIEEQIQAIEDANLFDEATTEIAEEFGEL